MASARHAHLAPSTAEERTGDNGSAHSGPIHSGSTYSGQTYSGQTYPGSAYPESGYSGSGYSESRHDLSAQRLPAPESPVSPQRPRPGEITSLQRSLRSRRGRHATARGENFPVLIGWTLLGSLIPGSGLIAAGRRTSGILAAAVGALLLGLVLTVAMISDPLRLAQAMISQPDRFIVLAGVLVTALLCWAALVISTNLAVRRFARPNLGQHLLSATLVVALIGLVAIPTARVTDYAVIARSTLTGIFSTGASLFDGTSPDSSSADPWANTARMNVLLIGSDAGADRVGIRPDTLILASINTQTGDTVLFSLPRNLEKVPFPPGTPQSVEYPDGFYCVDANGVPQCLLNAFWTFGEEHWQDYYRSEPDAFHAGLRATTEAVEQVTGLPVDQYAMVNLRGFTQFVDAIGGINVDVKERLPIGGSSENRVASGWIEAGPNQQLDGYHALWYARSRWSTDDYDRMRRQRCVISAVVEQADPARVALAFPEIAAAAKDNISTGIPLEDLSAWVNLTQKVQNAQVRSLPFTAKVINPEDPDIALMRSLVAESINPTQPSPAAPSPSTSVSPSPSAAQPSPEATTPSESQTSGAQNTADVC